MQFLRAIRPFQIIAAIADKHLYKNSTQKQIEHKDQQDSQLPPSYEQAEAFVVQLRRCTEQQKEKQNRTKRKLDIFSDLQIDPHYMGDIDKKRLVQFEFQMGSDVFLERIELLYDQTLQVTTAIDRVLEPSSTNFFLVFQVLDSYSQQLQQLIGKVSSLREQLRLLKCNRVIKIIALFHRKNTLKAKVKLLKNVKAKNESALMQISNIDQAFATEQSRSKLYKKIVKLSELQKSTYVMTIKKALINTAKISKNLVEKGLQELVLGQLKEKQIQKLMLMVYFVEREDVYRQNGIKIDFKCADKTALREQINKLFSWKQFHYIHDAATRSRINEFLSFLLGRLSDKQQ